MTKPKANHHKHKSTGLVASSKRFSAPLLVGVMTLLALSGVYIVYQSRAANASMTLTPATGTLALGSTVDVTITENSSTDAVNAVEANLTYDQTKLQFVSIDAAASPFTSPVINSGGNGSIKIVRFIANTTVTGNQHVAIVRFTAIGAGATNVTIDATSAITPQSAPTTNLLTIRNDASYTIADTTPPNAPTALVAGAKTVTTIPFSWTAPSDNVAVTGYKVFRNGTQIATITTNTPSYTDTGRTPNTSYSYTVSAFDAAGNNSALSAALTTSTLPDTTPPSAPTALVVGSRTVTTIPFSWTTSSDIVGVTGYKVFRNGTQIASISTNTPSYTDTGLAPNTSYSYTVSAFDAAGNNSTLSAALATSTLPDTTPPSVPSGLNSPNKTTSTVSLAWIASTDNVTTPGYVSYRILRNGVQVGTSATTSFTSTGLTQGTAYSFTVVAVDGAGNASAASAALAVTTTSKPGDITGDGVVGIADLSILATNYGRTGQTLATGDLTGDGIVNIYDLSVLATYWGT